MATLVLTRSGFDDIDKTLGRVPPQLWVNSDVLTEEELRELRESGHDVTHFTRHIALNRPEDIGGSSCWARGGKGEMS